MFESLRQNPLYDESDKYVFVDGPRDRDDEPLVREVVEIARRETANVTVSDTNKGLGNSIIGGVSKLLSVYDRVIVIEDDLRLMPGFLSYMNRTLDCCRDDSRILAVCGYSLKIKRPGDYRPTVYLGDRASSWGWGTWADRWKAVDWSVADWDEFSHDKRAQAEFNKRGSDMTSMLRGYMEGRNRSWAIRFCYHQFRHGLYSVHPVQSLVDNDGFGASATNCRQKYNRFKIELAQSVEPEHTENIAPDRRIIRQLHRYHSIPLRIYSRIRKILDI